MKRKREFGGVAHKGACAIYCNPGRIGVLACTAKHGIYGRRLILPPENRRDAYSPSLSAQVNESQMRHIRYFLELIVAGMMWYISTFLLES